jgi:gamma-glutamyltranspeptidase/glutathione hydrolase
LRSPGFAKTLARIAAEGKRGLYEGRGCERHRANRKSAGGGLQLADLANYRIVEREPLRVSWGKTSLTMPPPSAGGLLLVETLSLFQPAELIGHERHAQQARAPFGRSHARRLGRSRALRRRSGFVTVDVAKLLSPARLAAERR